MGFAMRELVYHMRRYLAWSAFGIVVFVTPVLLLTGGRAPAGPLLILIGFGSSIFVLIRAIIGAVTRGPAGPADRATAIEIRRFFIGWFMGLFIALVLSVMGKERWVPERFTPLRWGSHPLSWMLAGGLAVLLTDGFIYLRRFMLIVPIMWIAAFAGIMSAYFAFGR
jgi:hypothetical protein